MLRAVIISGIMKSSIVEVEGGVEVEVKIKIEVKVKVEIKV